MYNKYNTIKTNTNTAKYSKTQNNTIKHTIQFKIIQQYAI